MSRPYARPPRQPVGQRRGRGEGSTEVICCLALLLSIVVASISLTPVFPYWWNVITFHVILIGAVLFLATIIALVNKTLFEAERRAKRARTARRRRPWGWRFHSRTLSSTNEPSHLSGETSTIPWEETHHLPNWLLPLLLSRKRPKPSLLSQLSPSASPSPYLRVEEKIKEPEEVIPQLEALWIKVAQLEERLEQLRLASQRVHTMELGKASIPTHEAAAAQDRKENVKQEGTPPTVGTERPGETKQKLERS